MLLLPKLNSSLLDEIHKMIIIFGPHSEYNKAQVGALFVVYARLTLEREIVAALITVPTESRQTARFRDRMFLLTQWRSSDMRPRARHIHRINTVCRCIRFGGRDAHEENTFYLGVRRWECSEYCSQYMRV
jgi:hypothetical protein